jgi:hypothetical protein
MVRVASFPAQWKSVAHHVSTPSKLNRTYTDMNLLRLSLHPRRRLLLPVPNPQLLQQHISKVVCLCIPSTHSSTTLEELGQCLHTRTRAFHALVRFDSVVALGHSLQFFRHCGFVERFRRAWDFGFGFDESVKFATDRGGRRGCWTQDLELRSVGILHSHRWALRL